MIVVAILVIVVVAQGDNIKHCKTIYCWHKGGRGRLYIYEKQKEKGESNEENRGRPWSFELPQLKWHNIAQLLSIIGF